MQARFEDHAGFQRTVVLCVAGCALAAPVAVEAGAAGALLLLSLWPGREVRRRRLLAAAGAGLVAAWFFFGGWWPLPALGALTGLSFALGRREARDGLLPRRSAVLVAVALTASAASAAPLAAVLAPLLPKIAAGAAYGLWLGLAAAPLHLWLGDDPVEARLSALCGSLSPELRSLAERAAAARRGALDLLPRGARAEVRRAFDSLALAAVVSAEQAADLSRAASPGLENDLQRRAAALAASGAGSDDAATRQSYERAAEALQGQLEHLRRLRRTRDRAVARLHEEVATLERARFSLTVVDDPSSTAALDLLDLAIPSPAAEAALRSRDPVA
jgi:hypothetical protein